MEDKALLINNLLDEIHDNISILKEYGFKYDEFSIVYSNMEESFQKIVSSDTYNTNVQVLFEDERLNDLYNMCRSYNTQLKTKVSYFRIFQTTEKILKNYDNNCFEQYLREVLNDFHLYTFAIKEGYIEDEKSDKIYELIYKLIKKEYSTNYHSLLIDLLYKNTLLYKLKDYVEKDIEYHKKDGDIRRMIRECDYGFIKEMTYLGFFYPLKKKNYKMFSIVFLTEVSVTILLMLFILPPIAGIIATFILIILTNTLFAANYNMIIIEELLKRGYYPDDYNSSELLIKKGIYFKLQ